MGGRSTMDSVLASHPAAQGSNLGRDIFSVLFSLRTVLRSNPSVLKARDFANAVQRRPKPSTTKR